MIRIAITTAAYYAICATLLLGSVAVEAKANERGKLVWARPPLAAGTLTAERLVGGQFGDDLIDPLGRYPEQPQIGLAEFENEINGAGPPLRPPASHKRSPAR
jgi:hypothetical protein